MRGRDETVVVSGRRPVQGTAARRQPTNGGDLFYDYETSGTAGGCQSTLDSGSHIAVTQFSTGTKYCFLTSEHRTAWIRMNDLTGTGTRTRIVLNVRVW